MLKIRIIPCLDVKDGRVVFGSDADRQKLIREAEGRKAK